MPPRPTASGHDPGERDERPLRLAISPPDYCGRIDANQRATARPHSKFGGRFSRKARLPSRASGVLRQASALASSDLEAFAQRQVAAPHDAVEDGGNGTAGLGREPFGPAQRGGVELVGVMELADDAQLERLFSRHRHRR